MNRQNLAINNRIQLTLFVDPKEAVTIERVRQEFNPRQFELIKAHVTLCREDEIQDLEKVVSNLLLLTQTQPNIFIEFGKVEKFDNGKGVFLPGANENEQYNELRRRVLSGVEDNSRNMKPHITLMHPRNAACNDEIFKQIEKINFPTKLEFKQISLIEQVDGGKWKILKNFSFKKKDKDQVFDNTQTVKNYSHEI